MCVVLGPQERDYTYEVDVWSAGCILAEMLSMQKESVPNPNNRRPLFPGRSSNMSPRANDNTHDPKDNAMRYSKDVLSVKSSFFPINLMRSLLHGYSLFTVLCFVLLCACSEKHNDQVSLHPSLGLRV